jgi:hypothetical protein
MLTYPLTKKKKTTQKKEPSLIRDGKCQKTPKLFFFFFFFKFLFINDLVGSEITRFGFFFSPLNECGFQIIWEQKFRKKK